MKLIIQIAELKNKKEKLRKDLSEYEDKMVDLGVQVDEHHLKYKTLSFDNEFLNKRLKKITQRSYKRKGEESMIQF